MPHRQAVVDGAGEGDGEVIRRAIGLLLPILLLAACSTRANRQSFISSAMGCDVVITIDDDDAPRARAAARAAQEEIERLDLVLSDWKRSSELTALHASRALRTPASDDLRAALARALEVADASDGRFDPTVGAMVALWRESRKAEGLPAPAALEVARRRTGHAKVRLDGNDIVRERTDILLDFGGIGKGLAAVRAIALLEDHGCPRALVAVAGDLAASGAPRGERGWTIEIEPESPSVGRETVLLADGAISTSGGSVQWFEFEGVRYAHIVDPRTGLGATAVAQVTVVGPRDAAVDALGTALALTATDEEAARVLAAFPGYRARIERNGHARWIH
ncbi:MAG: Thiamine biosynthesis lipoprotein ApbE precursor [Planctomycetota bacterium]